jgi:FkbH-like protein
MADLPGTAVRYQLSPYVSQLEVEGVCVLVHAGRLERLVLDAGLAPACEQLRESGLSEERFVQLCGEDLGGAGAFALMRSRQFLLEVGQRGEAAHRLDSSAAATHAYAAPTSGRYWDLRPLAPSPHPRASDQPLTPLRVLAVGGCVLQFAEDSLVASGIDRGYDVRIRHRWPDPRADLRAAVAEWDPELTIFQPSIHSYLTGLLDDGIFRGERSRRRRLQALKAVLTSQVEDFAGLLDGRFGLVHNFAPPSFSAFGRFDYRTPVGFRAAIGDLNSHLDELVSPHDHLMVLDEERLVLRHGGVFDEPVFPFGHHGGLPDPDLERPNQLPQLSDLLASEYLACYQALAGVDRVRCLAVDLDGTLWPGIAAEDGFGWLDEDTTSRWMHLGLHQALRLLKSRGILLLSCSMGTREATLGPWREAHNRALLEPDDFVAHCIDWKPKPEKLAAACERLGLALADVVFLDDSRVQRAELQARLPAVRVLDAPVHAFRELLLTDPRCEVPEVTAEARTRTESARRMVEREEGLAAPGRGEFLASLEIETEVRPVGPDDLPRVAELIGRTNQFNTTGRRLTLRELRELQRGDGGIAVLFVRDRTTDYGLVGAMVVAAGVIEVVAISCRVISLDVAPRFVAEGVRSLGLAAEELCGRIVATDRNEPAREVFVHAGIRQLSEAVPVGSGEGLSP